MALIFRTEFSRVPAWREAFKRHMPDLDFRDWDEPGDVADIEFAMVWKPPRGVLRGFPNLKVIFSLGAGVDHLFSDPELPEGVPVVRMIEPELTRGMTEYVVLHVLRHHRRQREMEANQRAEKWEMISVPTAPSRKVGVMGLGELGGAAALALTALEFDVAGWSRSPKEFPGVECFHGDFGMDAFLARTEILICLLPLTAETEGILNAELFAKLPKGASLINAARGGHQVEEDILAALDRGQLSETTLDVFREEPLPAGHPCWRHPRVTITPHNASLTDPDGAVRQVIENIQRIRRGEPPSNIVDSKAGY
ncbi:MAG: glyoxylate/hydroxypyruvate reductase A [Alphaproteobacteria bacterium]|nr:glyoxylate/hydroxypyruvate reductase A [Alphaproteobacteria bacterium]